MRKKCATNSWGLPLEHGLVGFPGYSQSARAEAYRSLFCRARAKIKGKKQVLGDMTISSAYRQRKLLHMAGAWSLNAETNELYIKYDHRTLIEQQ